MAAKPLSPQRNNVIAKHLNVPELLPPGRCVGKSTAIALRTISHALQYPGQEINIRDHAAGAKCNEHLAYMIATYIGRLGFVGFEIKKGYREITLVFNLHPETK